MKDNKIIAKKYLNKFFKSNYIEEKDTEFKALVRLLNKAEKRSVLLEEIKGLLAEILKLSKYDANHDNILDNFGDIETAIQRFNKAHGFRHE